MHKEKTTDSGLIVVSEDEEGVVEKIGKALRGKKTTPDAKVMGRSTKASGIETITEARMETQHKLDSSERKSRREDNRHMAQVRKCNRKRRKHGR